MHRALSNNLFAVGSFIDIKAAFDSITFSSIMSAIRELNLPPFLTAWIHKFLTTKTVIFNLKGMALIRFIIKGTPQGGVLSPFLWNLVFNSLITKLQDLINNYEVAQGFADDLAGVMTGQDLQVILRRTQAFMDTIIRWCNDHHLELSSSSKTCIIIFTWKRKFQPSPASNIYEFILPFSSSVKYLGVTLENKLNWNMHVDNTASQAKSTQLTASIIIGKRWGATGSQARWI